MIEEWSREKLSLYTLEPADVWLYDWLIMLGGNLPTFSEDFKPDFMSTCQVWSIIYEFCYLHTFNLWQDCKNDTFNSGSVVSLVVPILKNGGRLLKSFTLLNHITATALQQSSNWSSRRPISKTPGKDMYIQTKPSSLKNFSNFWKKLFGLWCSCPTNGYTCSEKCDWQCHFMKHTVRTSAVNTLSANCKRCNHYRHVL